MAGVMKVFIDLDGKAWGLSDVVQACLSERNLRNILSLTEEGRDLIATHLDGDTASKSVLSTLRTRLFPFKSVAALWKINRAKGRTFSLKNFLESNQILILGNNQSATAPIQAINQVLFKRLSELLLDLP
jgi:hypothetical protein